MSRLFRVLSVAALASSTTLAQAQQPVPQPVPGQAQPGQAQPGQVQPGQVQPGQVQPGQVQPGQVQPGQVQPGQVQPGQVQPGQVQPGQVQPGQPQPGRPGQVISGQQPGPVGQSDPTRVRAAQAGQAGMQAQGVSLSAFVAHQLKRGNEAEVELGQLASQRAKNDSVKQFASMMVQSHQEMIQKLEQFDQGVGAGRGAPGQRENSTRDNTSNSQAPGNQDRSDNNTNRRDNTSSNAPVDGARNNVRNSESNTDDDPRASDRAPSTGTSQSSSGTGTSPQSTATPGAAQATRTQTTAQAGINQGPGAQVQGGRPGQMAGMSGHVPHMLVAIEDQASDNELQLTKQMLEKHEGEDFEMAYIGQQIVAHTCMLAKLQALKNAGPQELQQLVAQGEQTTRQHLDQAMKIAKELGEDKK